MQIYRSSPTLELNHNICLFLFDPAGLGLGMFQECYAKIERILCQYGKNGMPIAHIERTKRAKVNFPQRTTGRRLSKPEVDATFKEFDQNKVKSDDPKSFLLLDLNVGVLRHMMIIA